MDFYLALDWSLIRVDHWANHGCVIRASIWYLWKLSCCLFSWIIKCRRSSNKGHFCYSLFCTHLQTDCA